MVFIKPIVAIVGRPNVGKSTLFNYLGKQKLSIVEDLPGVTRDRLYMDSEWRGREFTMVDTGGIELVNNDKISMAVRYQAKLAIEESDVVVMMADVKTGVTAEDMEVAQILHSANKPVLLAVNKVDSPKQEMEVFDFYSLGLGEPIAISSTNALNLGELLDAIFENFPEPKVSDDELDDIIHIALVGRPNVGKSSIVNKILGEERVVVSDVAGTTRDAIDTPFSKDRQEYVLIDTAGMRRKARVEKDTIERYSVIRALRAVERADVVLLILDAAEGITEQDKKIAGYVHEAGKATIIVYNKWDLIEKDDKTSLKFIEQARNELVFMQYAPVMFISALTGQRVVRITGVVNYVAEQNSLRISTGLLNKVVEDAVAANPPPTHKGKKLRILYVTQAKVKPPSFVLFVNNGELMHFSYLRFIENRLREAFGFEGTPIRLIVRNRREKEE